MQTTEFLLTPSSDSSRIFEFHSLLNRPYDSFISIGLDASYSPTPRFHMRGFFLEASINASIKSFPIYIFSLYRAEARETYISCFYAETWPTLFEKFIKVGADPKYASVFFNWFEHENIVPGHPVHRDDISNVFYFNEGRFLDYRVFDITLSEMNRARRLAYSTYFSSTPPKKKRFIQRSRFYRRKFHWFLKYHSGQLKWT